MATQQPEIQLASRDRWSRDLQTSRPRAPTLVDWQRWQPIIISKYKTATAGMLRREMAEGGLHVTVKMLRDRYRRWGINDKNRRRHAERGRQTQEVPTIKVSQAGVYPISNDTTCDKCGLDLAGPTTAVKKEPFNENYDSSRKRSAWPDDLVLPGNLYLSPMSIYPKEEMPLRRMLSGLMNWSISDSAEVMRFKASYEVSTSGSVYRFANCLYDISSNVATLETGLLSPRQIIRRLTKVSADILGLVETALDPLSVLMSIGKLISFRSLATCGDVTWRKATASYLLRVSTDQLGESHPVTLLLQETVLGQVSPRRLAMLYGVAMDLFEKFCRPSETVAFRIKFMSAISRLGYDAHFDHHHASLFNETKIEYASLSPRFLANLAFIRSKQGRWDEVDRLARRSISAIQIQDKKMPYTSIAAWQYLALAQCHQCDFINAEISFLTAVASARDLGNDVTDCLYETLASLYAMYESNGEIAKCNALRRDYPEAFAE